MDERARHRPAQRRGAHAAGQRGDRDRQGSAGEGRRAEGDPRSTRRRRPANNALARANLALKKPQDAAGPARAALELNPYTNLTLLPDARRGLQGPEAQDRLRGDAERDRSVARGHEGARRSKTEAEQLQKEVQGGLRLGLDYGIIPVTMSTKWKRLRRASSRAAVVAAMLVAGLVAYAQDPTKAIKPNKNWVFLLSHRDAARLPRCSSLFVGVYYMFAVIARNRKFATSRQSWSRRRRRRSRRPHRPP